MTIYASNVLQVPIQPTPVELARLNVPFLGVLTRFITSDQTLRWNANFGGSTATAKAVIEDHGAPTADKVDQASLPIGQRRFEDGFELLTTNISTAAARGQDVLANMVQYSVGTKRRELLKKLGSAVINGTGSAADAGIIGIANLVATSAGAGASNKQKATGAYAGVNPATAGYELWTSLVYTNFGDPTQKKLNEFAADLLQGMTTGVPSSYDMLLMSPMTAIKYGEVFNTVADMNTTAVGGIDLGYGTKKFANKPVIEDPNVPNGEIYFIDSTQLRLYSFDELNAPYMNDETPVDSLMFYSGMLPVNNLQKKRWEVYGMFQLEVRDRTAVNVIKGVTI